MYHSGCLFRLILVFVPLKYRMIATSNQAAYVILNETICFLKGCFLAMNIHLSCSE